MKPRVVSEEEWHRMREAAAALAVEVEEKLERAAPDGPDDELYRETMRRIDGGDEVVFW